MQPGRNITQANNTTMLEQCTTAITTGSALTKACLALALGLVAISLAAGRRKAAGMAPGPFAWPVLGSLHLMHGYKVPYGAFTALSKVYGKVFSITLGTSRCLVVNDLKSVREVLSEKDQDFDSRPDFKRFDEALFGGDKQNCKFRNF